MKAKKDMAKYSRYRLSPSGKETGVKRFADDQAAQRKRIENRWAIVEEKGFSEGCRIQWIQKPSTKRILKRISADGFLIIENSSNRESPSDWDVLK